MMQLGAHALLDTRDELAWNRSADHLVDELEPASGLQRLDLEVADRVLAVAAALLDVPAMTLGASRQGLAQRDPDVDLVDLDAVPVAEPVEQYVGMGLTHAPQHQLESLGVMLDPNARILGGKSLQCLPSLSSSAFACATTAIGSSGSGIDHGSITSGLSLSLRVSPVSARVSFAIAQMSPAIDDATVRWVLPSGDDKGADALVLVVVLVAAVVAVELSWSGRTRARSHRAGPCPRRPGPG